MRSYLNGEGLQSSWFPFRPAHFSPHSTCQSSAPIKCTNSVSAIYLKVVAKMLLLLLCHSEWLLVFATSASAISPLLTPLLLPSASIATRPDLFTRIWLLLMMMGLCWGANMLLIFTTTPSSACWWPQVHGRLSQLPVIVRCGSIGNPRSERGHHLQL